jgi:hypothetical protein
MKTSRLFLCSFCFFSLLCLGGCSSNNEVVNLDFGRLYDSSLSSTELAPHVTSLTYSTLTSHHDNKENFLLLVGEVNSTCVCFAKFRSTLLSYLSKHNADLYVIDPSEFDGAGKSTFDLKIGGTGYETIAIFKDGVIAYQNQRSGEEDSWSNDYDTFLDWIKVRARVPSMYYISLSQLSTFNATHSEYVLGFLRASCPDCSYLAHHFLKSFNTGDYNASYVIDCDAVGIRYDAAGNLDKVQWQAFKDAYGLSTALNKEFGYGTGYVPCFAFYNNGSIDDFAVYVNDTLSVASDGSASITTTYWDGSRTHPFFESLDSSVVTNILNLSVPSSDVDEGSWTYEAAAKYHDPLMKGFLSYWLSKK